MQWLDKEIKELKTQLKALWASNGAIVAGPQVASSRLARWMPSWGRAKRQADDAEDEESANVPKPSKAPKKAEGLDSEDRAATRKRFRQTPEQYQAEPARREGNQDTISGTKMPVSPPLSVGVPYPVGTLCEFQNGVKWYPGRITSVEHDGKSFFQYQGSKGQYQEVDQNDEEDLQQLRILSPAAVAQDAPAPAAQAAVTPTTPTAPAQAERVLTTPTPASPAVLSEDAETPPPTANVVTVPNVISTPIVNELIAENAELVFTQDNPKVKGSNSHARYSLYCRATTATTFLDLGGRKADLKNDLQRGFCKPVDPVWVQRLNDLDGKQDDQQDDLKCVTCDSPHDGANMLLCDKCGNGYHLKCLTPPLEAVPKGDWFCPTCATAL